MIHRLFKFRPPTCLLVLVNVGNLHLLSRSSTKTTKDTYSIYACFRFLCPMWFHVCTATLHFIKYPEWYIANPSRRCQRCQTSGKVKIKKKKKKIKEEDTEKNIRVNKLEIFAFVFFMKRTKVAYFKNNSNMQIVLKWRAQHKTLAKVYYKHYLTQKYGFVNGFCPNPSTIPVKVAKKALPTTFPGSLNISTSCIQHEWLVFTRMNET